MFSYNVHLESVADLEFWKGGFQYVCPARISDLLRSFLVNSWGEIAKVGQQTAVVFETRRINGVTPLKVRENKRSPTDSISASLAAEGAMHE